MILEGSDFFRNKEGEKKRKKKERNIVRKGSEVEINKVFMESIKMYI